MAESKQRRPITGVQIPKELADTLKFLIDSHKELGFKTLTDLATFILRNWAQDMIQKDKDNLKTKQQLLEQQLSTILDDAAGIVPEPSAYVMETIEKRFRERKTIEYLAQISKDFSMKEQKEVIAALGKLKRAGKIRLGPNYIWEWVG